MTMTQVAYLLGLVAAALLAIGLHTNVPALVGSLALSFAFLILLVAVL